jgi:hypothetical protein
VKAQFVYLLVQRKTGYIVVKCEICGAEMFRWCCSLEPGIMTHVSRCSRAPDRASPDLEAA